MCSAYTQAYETSDRRKRTMRKENNMALSNFGFKLALAGFASAVLFVLPAISAPISVFPKGALEIVPSDDAQILLVRGERGGAHRGGAVRGGAAYRGGAVRGGAAYRGGAVVRRGAVVTGGGGYYGGGYCDPNYQYCGGGGYYTGGVYRGGAVAGGVYRGGAYARGGAARGGGAHVAHRGGGRRR
jgi:hypothetical protein